MSAAPVECTTWAGRKRHLSTALVERKPAAGGGHHGVTLCGDFGYDQPAIEAEYRVCGGTFRKSVSALPLCKRCEVKEGRRLALVALRAATERAS